MSSDPERAQRKEKKKPFRGVSTISFMCTVNWAFKLSINSLMFVYVSLMLVLFSPFFVFSFLRSHFMLRKNYYLRFSSGACESHKAHRDRNLVIN